MATFIVRTPAQLAAALTNADADTYVYLAEDITLTGGIAINSGKTSLVIDGEYEGATHTLTEVNSSLPTDTIRLGFASNIAITLKNIIINGKNYYGIPSISEGSGYNNVSVSYINVTYTGPQIAYNPNGLTRFTDCDITISDGYSLAQEAGEVCRVEIGGVTNIRHNGLSDAAFWFRGDANAAYFKVLSGANVTINTVNYFMYCTLPIIPIQRPVAYTVEPDASFTLEANKGMSFNSNHRAAAFLVDTGASFRYIQSAQRDSNASLYINGAFTVNQGARVYMQADFDNTGSLLQFMSAAASLYADRPKSFALYSRNRPALSFADLTAPMDFRLAGKQLNYWLTPEAFPVAGTLADIPDAKWLKGVPADFYIAGNTTSSQTRVTDHNFTQAELDDLPPLGELHLYDARVLSLGDLPLTLYPIIDAQRVIGGLTDPYATVLAEYTAGPDAADEDGQFAIATLGVIPVGTVVKVLANVPFLITEAEETVRSAGELTLESAPDRIRFVMPPVSRSPLLLPRENPSDPVVVYDTRAVAAPWELWASIDGPMHTDGGYTLPDAVVLVEGGSLKELGTAPIRVYLSDPDGGSQSVIWPEDEGILLHVTAPMLNRAVYTAQLTWDLRPV